jgi:type I restriction enzyme S subunit
VVTSQGDVRFIKAENIVNNQVYREPENYIDNETNEILSRSELHEGDILFVIAGETLGKIAILNNDFLPANTNQAISFIRLIDKSSRVFLWYYLQSLTITRIIWLNAVQSAQPNLSIENPGNFYIPYPSSEEQQSIVRHIETECALIDAKRAKTEKLIELLTEYRTALISEVVTGKIKVID